MDAPVLHHEAPGAGPQRDHAAFSPERAGIGPTVGPVPATTTAAHEYVEACIMVTLGEGPAYGYGLKADLDELGLAGLDRGRIYRALRAMEAEGLVASHWDTAGRGPARRTYDLTAHGHRRLAAQAVAVRRQRRELSRFLSRYERVRTGRSEEVA